MNDQQRMQEILHIVSHDIENACINIEWMGKLLQESLMQAQHADHTALHKSMPQYLDLMMASSADVKHKIKGFRDLRAWLFYQPKDQSFQIGTAITDVIQALPSTVSKTTIDIYVHVDDAWYSDEHAMKKIIQELLLNALHAIDNEHGNIMISIKQDGDQYILMVQDNGCGISQYDLEHIYDPYFIALPKYEHQNPISKRQGIGLSIVQTIVDHLNGRTWARCADDHVTQFYVSLPIHHP